MRLEATFGDFGRHQGDEFGQGSVAFEGLVGAGADVDHAGFLLLGAHDEHVRHLGHLGAADLGAELVGRTVDAAADLGGREDLGHGFAIGVEVVVERDLLSDKYLESTKPTVANKISNTGN